MKIRAQCVPCLLTRGHFEGRIGLAGREDLRQAEARAIRAGLDEIHKHYDPEACSAFVATRMHRAIYEALGTDDPYLDIKRRSNDVALKLVPKARAFINSSDHRLEAAILVSVVGNLMDFGIEGVLDSPEALEDAFDDIVGHGLDVNHLCRAKEFLNPGAGVLYLTDNAGEIVFDVLAVEVLKEMGCSVTVMVKGAPILTDATMEDVRASGMDRVANTVITTGSDAIGLALEDLDPAARERLFGSDLVIAKGMANYEALSEPEYLEAAPILYLLRTKCRPVADDLGVGKDLNVAYLFSP